MGVWGDGGIINDGVNYSCFENKGFLPQDGRRMKVPSEVDEHIEINEMPMRKKKSSVFSAGAVVLTVWWSMKRRPGVMRR